MGRNGVVGITFILRLIVFIIGINFFSIILKEEARNKESQYFLMVTGRKLEEETEKFSYMERVYNGNKQLLRIGSCILLCTIGSILIITGIQKMKKHDKIQQEGQIANATILKLEKKKNYYEIHTVEYYYLVEFELDGRVVQGKMISSQSYILGRQVDIKYLPEQTYGKVDVVKANNDIRAGVSEQLYGVILLIIGMAIFGVLRKK